MSAITWKELKRACNRIPEERLKDSVIIWTEDEKSLVVTGIVRLEEDYLFNEDDAVEPKSALKDTIAECKKEGTYCNGDFHVVHKKGTRILHAE